MRRRACLCALCAAALSAVAMPTGLRLAALADADAADDGPGAAVSAATPGGNRVDVPEAWLARFPDVLLAANGSVDAAVTNRAANGRTAAECYAAGLDPTDATNDFRIVSIELVDGEPQVEWEPKTNRWTGAELNATLKGAANLNDTVWQTVTDENRESFRFFKAEVALP